MQRKTFLALATTLTLLGAAPAALAQVALAPEDRIVAPDADFADEFGTGVAIAGSTAVLGSPSDDDVQPGNFGANSGSAYVFVRSGSSWTFEAKVTASDAALGARFGTDVAVVGNEMVVLAPQVQGPSDGAAYVFARQGSTWTETARVTVDDPVNPVGLIGPMDFDGTRIAVGSKDFGQSQGCVYVLIRQNGAWVQEARVQSADGQLHQGLGKAVALRGDVLVAGAPNDDDGAQDAGAVYVFRRQGSTWTQEAKLVGSAAAQDDFLGTSVAYDAGTIVAGAPGDDDGGAESGSVYVFRLSGSTWVEEAVLPGQVAGDETGTAVALEGDRLVASAPLRDVPGGMDAGALLLWERQGTSWTLVDTEFSTGGFGAKLGTSLAVHADRLLAGAPAEGFQMGAAHVYTLQGGVARYCSGKVNSQGCVPLIAATGAPSATSTAPFRIDAVDVVPGESGVLLYGPNSANLDYHGGKLCVRPPNLQRMPFKLATPIGTGNCSGVMKRNFQKRIQSGSDPLLTVGQTVHAQWQQRDPGDPAGFGDSLTDAVRFTIAP